MDDLLTEFLVEAKDLIDSTDDKLVQLEKHPDDPNIINAVFRGYHTIKGGAGFLELHGLVRLCHNLETLFDSLRSGALTMNRQIMDVSLIASNEIRRAMNLFTNNPNAQYSPPEPLIEQLSTLANGGALTSDEPALIVPLTLASDPVTPTTSSTQIDHFVQAWELFSPTDQSLNSHSTELGDHTLTHHSLGTTLKTINESAPHPSAASSSNTLINDKQEKDTQIKVDTHRLDAVLTLASEVGLAKNRVMAAKAKIMNKDFSELALSNLDRAVADLDRLSSNLQNAVMLTRMQPIGRLFAKYPRIVRDLARTLNKNIDIELSGHETEIDKGMIEDLADPLVHLIRNSADHGIEEPHLRVAAGKPEIGRIFLTAKQEGDRIVIEIKDDGKGIDPQFLRTKAKQKNLLDHSIIDTLTDQQALELIFYPGFSTAEKLSSVSGRGVGMDVVKTNITKLGGEIELQSQIGIGSIITIRLPLTLAVLPVLLLRAADQPLALPLSSVHEIVSLEEQKIQYTAGKPVLNLRGEILRLLDLADLLHWKSKTPASVAAVIDLGNSKRFALCAQDFIGREEVMVKALEGTKPKGVSGVMVDAQGDIVLILDLKELTAQIVN